MNVFSDKELLLCINENTRVIEEFFGFGSKRIKEPSLTNLLKSRHTVSELHKLNPNIKYAIRVGANDVYNETVLKLTNDMIKHANTMLTYNFLIDFEESKRQLLGSIKKPTQVKRITALELNDIKTLQIQLTSISDDDEYDVLFKIVTKSATIVFKKEIFELKGGFTSFDIETVNMAKTRRVKEKELQKKENNSVLAFENEFKNKLIEVVKTVPRKVNPAVIKLADFTDGYEVDSREEPVKTKLITIPKNVVVKMTTGIIKSVVSGSNSVGEITGELEHIIAGEFTDEFFILDDIPTSFTPSVGALVLKKKPTYAVVWYRFTGRLFSDNGQGTVFFWYDIKSHKFKFLEDGGRFDIPDNSEDPTEFIVDMFKRHNIR